VVTQNCNTSHVHAQQTFYDLTRGSLRLSVVSTSLRNPLKVFLDPAGQTLNLFCSFTAHDGETVVHPAVE
jgi:hypothetical protein